MEQQESHYVNFNPQIDAFQRNKNPRSNVEQKESFPPEENSIQMNEISFQKKQPIKKSKV